MKRHQCSDYYMWYLTPQAIVPHTLLISVSNTSKHRKQTQNKPVNKIERHDNSMTDASKIFIIKIVFTLETMIIITFSKRTLKSKMNKFWEKRKTKRKKEHENSLCNISYVEYKLYEYIYTNF